MSSGFFMSVTVHLFDPDQIIIHEDVTQVTLYAQHVYLKLLHAPYFERYPRTRKPQIHMDIRPLCFEEPARVDPT